MRIKIKLITVYQYIMIINAKIKRNLIKEYEAYKKAKTA